VAARRAERDSVPEMGPGRGAQLAGLIVCLLQLDHRRRYESSFDREMQQDTFALSRGSCETICTTTALFIALRSGEAISAWRFGDKRLGLAGLNFDIEVPDKAAVKCYDPISENVAIS